jgi:hypothetical protein
MHKVIVGFIIGVLTLHSTLFAQKDFASLDLMLKEPNMFAVIPDSSGEICIFYKDPKFYSFGLINPEGKTIRTRTFNRIINSDSPERYIGATITKETFILFFSSSSDCAKYSAYYISRLDSNDNMIRNIVLKKPVGDKFIRTFTDSRYTYVVTSNNKTQKISFMQFLNENEVRTYSYPVSKNLFKYVKKDDLTLIKNNQSYTVSLTSVPCKIYVTEPGKIIYTIDDKLDNSQEEGAGGTSVLEFDFADDKMNYYIIPEKGEGYSNSYSNSFYYKGKLFRIQLFSDQIGLYIIDVKTGKLEKKYEYERNSKLDLVSSKVIRKSEDTYSFLYDNERPLEKDSKIFNKLSEGLPSISVRSYEGDTLILLIGSYNEVKNYSPGTMTGGGIGGGAPHMTGGSTTTSYYTTWFHSFLNGSSYEIVPGMTGESEYFKIEKYKSMLKEQGQKISTYAAFRIKGKLYLGYTLKKDNSYKIVEIL